MLTFAVLIYAASLGIGVGVGFGFVVGVWQTIDAICTRRRLAKIDADIDAEIAKEGNREQAV